MGGSLVRSSIAVALALGCVAVAAPAAEAAVRIAEPDGDGPEPCVRADPCSAGAAINNAEDDDVVRMLPGTYAFPVGLTIGPAVTVRADDPTNRPHLTSAADRTVWIVSGGSTKLQDLNISHTGATSALALGNEDVAERVKVDSSGAMACELRGRAMLRDSECLATATAGFAVGMDTSGHFIAARVVNVTAISPGDFSAAIWARQTGDNTRAQIDAFNTIAYGGGVDVLADESGTGTATAAVNLRNSNFDSVQAAGSASITQPSANGNQDAAPLFVDAGLGDYHQLRGSPTRDAGDGSVEGLGRFDLDRQARVQGRSIDIGADEFDARPRTRITRGPSRTVNARGGKAAVRFRFRADEAGSRFRCRLNGGSRDQRRWRSCPSPKRYRLGRGAYRFKVRAVDGTGNRDRTPAERRFHVRPA